MHEIGSNNNGRQTYLSARQDRAAKYQQSTSRTNSNRQTRAPPEHQSTRAPEQQKLQSRSRTANHSSKTAAEQQQSNSNRADQQNSRTAPKPAKQHNKAGQHCSTSVQQHSNTLFGLEKFPRQPSTLRYQVVWEKNTQVLPLFCPSLKISKCSTC